MTMKTKRMIQIAAAAMMLWANEGVAKSISLPLPSFEEAYKTADIVIVGKEVGYHLVYCDFTKTGKCKKQPFNKDSRFQMYKRKFEVLRKLKGTTDDYVTIMTESEAPFKGEYLLFLYDTPPSHYEAGVNSLGFSNNDPRRPQALEFIKKITGEDYAPSAQ